MYRASMLSLPPVGPTACHAVCFEGDREGLRGKPSLAHSRMTQRIFATSFLSLWVLD